VNISKSFLLLASSNQIHLSFRNFPSGFFFSRHRSKDFGMKKLIFSFNKGHIFKGVFICKPQPSDKLFSLGNFSKSSFLHHLRISFIFLLIVYHIRLCLCFGFFLNILQLNVFFCFLNLLWALQRSFETSWVLQLELFNCSSFGLGKA